MSAGTLKPRTSHGQSPGPAGGGREEEEEEKKKKKEEEEGEGEGEEEEGQGVLKKIKRSPLSLDRKRKGHRQSEQHWNSFRGNAGEHF